MRQCFHFSCLSWVKKFQRSFFFFFFPLNSLTSVLNTYCSCLIPCQCHQLCSILILTFLFHLRTSTYCPLLIHRIIFFFPTMLSFFHNVYWIWILLVFCTPSSLFPISFSFFHIFLAFHIIFHQYLVSFLPYFVFSSPSHYFFRDLVSFSFPYFFFLTPITSLLPQGLPLKVP